MAQVRAAVVNTNVLAEVAAELRARRGRPPRARGGDLRRPQQGLHPRRRLRGAHRRHLPRRRLGSSTESSSWSTSAADRGSSSRPRLRDHKTRLQEFVVHMHGQAPRYEVVGSGPDHDRRFSANVYVAGTSSEAVSGARRRTPSRPRRRRLGRSLTRRRRQHRQEGRPPTAVRPVERIGVVGHESRTSPEALVSDA